MPSTLILQTTSLLLLHHRLSDHDVQRNVPATTLQLDRTALLESKLAVDGRIANVARLQVASAAFTIRHLGNVFDELTSMSLTTSSRLRAEVDQVPSLVLTIAQCRVHGIVEERKELVEEASLALWREAVIETPLRVVGYQVSLSLASCSYTHLPCRCGRWSYSRPCSDPVASFCHQINRFDIMEHTYHNATASKCPTVVTSPLRM
jgi:hypothetical protein